MYLLFKSVSDQQLGVIKRYGHYLDYTVGFLDDSIKDAVEISHLNAVVISEEAAKAWKFAGNWTGYLSVRAGTASNEQLNFILSSTEAPGTKTKYYLTDDDKAAATLFMKVAMRKVLDDVYDKRMKEVSLNASQLEQVSWAQQRSEAEAYTADPTASTPLLSSLATARQITVSQMVTKVMNAVQEYNNNLATLLARKQLVESEIKACTDVFACNILMHNRFGYSMPPKQQEQAGITESSKYDL